MIIGTIFKDVGKGFQWVGSEAKAAVTEVPKALDKLIVLSNDAKHIASDAVQEVITISTDVSALVVAVVKDDGASLKAIEALIAAAGTAIAAKGLDFTEDVAVVTAVETFFASLNGTNYVDVMAAIAKTIADGKGMTATVIADFQKLEADATS